MKLPAKVQADFEDMQHKSELLVAGVQSLIVVLLSLLYYLSPAGHSPDAPVLSAPLGLGLFFILVVVRWWFAYTRQLTPVFLGFSVVIEMAVLIFTIWTYHLQFEAPAPVNLKNTHIAYVFILISLRALRFEPIWVVLSGITAVLGWGLVVFHSLMETHGAIVTWGYVTYVSSRSLHPGGEFDKILAILLVTAVTAYTLKRAKATLLTAVAQTQATHDLSRFFDADVAEKITGSDRPLSAGEGEERSAAIIFTDMRGFTKASMTLSSNQLITLLSEYQRLIIPIIRKHGGNIDKFMGDGILASFGAVIPSASYAADVMRAVDEIHEAAERWKKERAEKGLTAVGVGAGVAVGNVVFGMIGLDDRLEYTVIGEPVNLAAKLEKHNKEEHANALTDLPALELAKAQGYISVQEKEIRKGRNVAGVTGPVDIAVLA